MDRARHEVFARAALAGDQDGEVVALHALDLLGTRFIAALAQMNPGSSGSSGRSLDGSRGCGGRSRSPHNSKPWRATDANMRSRRLRLVRWRAARRRRRRARRRSRCPSGSVSSDTVAVLAAAREPRRVQAPGLRRRCSQPTRRGEPRRRRRDEHDRCIGLRLSREARSPFRAPAGPAGPRLRPAGERPHRPRRSVTTTASRRRAAQQARRRRHFRRGRARLRACWNTRAA